jgi:DNA relaxase NicK
MSLKSAVFSFDWVTFTIHASIVDVIPLVALLGLAEGLEDAGHGLQGYGRALRGQANFTLGCEPGAGREYCSLFLSGQTLDFVGVDRLVLFYAALCETRLKFNISRCDLAFDTQDFPVMAVREAREAGLVECRAKTYNPVGPSYKGDVMTGHTLYFGSRESDALLRIYHKMDGSSFGDEAFTRVELQLMDDRALFAFLSIMASDMSEWAGMAGNLLLGYFNIAAEWWSDWVAGFGQAWLKVRRKVPAIAAMENWLFKAVAPTLATWVAARTGGDVDDMSSAVRALLNHGHGRLGGRHKAIIEGFNGDPKTDFAVFAF